jgi:hypothetical protein
MQLEDWVVDILMSDELTKTDHRLFWYLFKLERLGDRFVDLPSQSEIALALGVTRQTINQSQAKLQELGLWDFKITGWKALNLVGPNSYTISEKTESATASLAEVVEVGIVEEELGFTPLVERQKLGHKSAEELPSNSRLPSNCRQDGFKAADLQILKEIERIAYDWRKRPWMESPNTFKPEIVQAVWQCNTQWYSLEGSKTPNLKKIGDRLRKLDGQLKKLDSGAIEAYSELQNYWNTAQAITNPEIEQAFNQAAIRQKQQQTRSSIEQALNRPEGDIF